MLIKFNLVFNSLLLVGFTLFDHIMKTIRWIATLLLFSTSCERLLIQPDNQNTGVGYFDALWQLLDEKYTYFTYKNINWNALRDQYRPQAAKARNNEELFNAMADLLYQLQDGHVNLTSSFNISRNWEWYLDYPPNFNYDVLERNYLGQDYQLVGSLKVKQFPNTGYIYYGSFERPFSPAALDDVILKFKKAGVKGLIIDIRDNGGGSLGYADQFIQRFLAQKTLIGYTRYKKGPGHDDFTDFFPKNLEPAGQTLTNLPVVLLTNRSVYSAANYFASALSQLPQVTLIGDQTGGGGGAPISSDLPNGWRVRYSATQLFNANKQHLEDGVVPDIKRNNTPSLEAQGIDSILESALDFIGR
jgi:hypothetical protein